MTKKKFYKELNKVSKTIFESLNSHISSTILQKFYYDRFLSFIYGNLIINFFSNLNKNEVKNLKLENGKIGIIKRKLNDYNIESKKAISFKKSKLNKNYYTKFKKDLKKLFPGFEKICLEIEKVIDLTSFNEYIEQFKKDITNSGKKQHTYTDIITTIALENSIEKNKDLPDNKQLKKLFKDIKTNVIPKISKSLRKELNKTSSSQLQYSQKFRSDFEKRLYKRWKKPLDLLELLISISLELGEKKKEYLGTITDSNNNFIHEAMIKIHARSLLIANEILTLLKAGYPDGANARWRSLHELAIFSFFLTNNNNEISERYLLHAYVRSYKQALSYRENAKKLGYKQLDLRIVKRMKREVDSLNTRFGDDYKKGDYNWIPKKILKDRNFAGLEKHVKINHLRPYVNMSSNSVHAGAKGFFMLGLMDGYQEKILLAGASNYGLSDPLQSTAISLLQITVCLLTINPDFDNIIEIQVMETYVEEIKSEATKVQAKIEQDMKKYMI